MKTSILLRALLAMLVLAASAAWAQSGAPERDTTKWYFNSFPPYHIVGGPDESKGAFDRALQLLIKGMPQQQHELVEAALPRMLDALRTRPDVCTVALLRNPEREAIVDFSLPHSHLLPNGIIVLRRRAAEFKPYLNERGELRLDEFLGSGKFRLAVAPTRSYGTVVDPLLKKHAAAIVPVQSTGVFASRLLKLTNQDEFDAMIGYAVELKYSARETRLDARDYLVMPIAGSSALLPVSVSCSRSEQGRRTLAAANRILSDKAVLSEIDAHYRSWLDDESSAHHEKLVRQLRGAR